MSPIVNLAKNASSKSSKLRWRVGATIVMVAFVASLLTAMMLGGTNALLITRTDYGFPLMNLRVYQPFPINPLKIVLSEESILSLFFPRALVFDIVFAIVTLASAAFCIYRWSASWNAGGYVTFFSLCLIPYLPLVTQIPVSLRLALILVLYVIPLLLVCFAACATWHWAMRLCGNRRGWLAFLAVACSFVGFLYWAYPHDMYSSPTLADVPSLTEQLSSDNPRLRRHANRALKNVRKSNPFVFE
jgi:hypothetical protein